MDSEVKESLIEFLAKAEDDLNDALKDTLRPSVVYRPAVKIDGDKWRALYGNSLGEGVAGFGDSPELAMEDFDREWEKKLRKEPNRTILDREGKILTQGAFNHLMSERDRLLRVFRRAKEFSNVEATNPAKIIAIDIVDAYNEEEEKL